MMCYYCFFFFFQAEDGIRDLVRSRGLGDVYKRQAPGPPMTVTSAGLGEIGLPSSVNVAAIADAAGAVSYTHLTLPTSDLV